jgi:DNA primase small subunit
LKTIEGTNTHRTVEGVGPETWKRILEFSAVSASAKVDTVVTTDVHRLIRLKNTLHSKSGFKKVQLAVSQVKEFDPFMSAVAFKNGAATVFISDAPKFRIGEEKFGPYKNQQIELPTAAALLLVCKGRAKVVE